MTDKLICLYPESGTASLQGLYLHSDIRARAALSPLVYTNFITSLDGRIALVRPDGCHQIPSAITNPRDWRLFQELAAVADVLITSGRYLRDLTQGQAQDFLPVSSKPEYADLLAFRLAQGLSPQPAVAVISASLDFPLSTVKKTAEHREMVVLTGSHADPARRRALEDAGIPVVTAGEERVDGERLIAALSARNYKAMYSIAGPGVCHTLLAAGHLHRLYITLAHRLLGGSGFDTFVGGPVFDPPLNLRLASLYLDTHALDGAGQCFARYDL